MQKLKSLRPVKEILFSVFYLLASGAVFIKLALRKSAEPSLFGWYSLPYLAFLILLAGGLTLFGRVLARRRFRILQILLVNAMVLAGCLLPMELAAQAYAYFHPSYEVLAWQPDRDMGWKLVPHLHWIWAGNDWFARDFVVPLAANSYGFLDLERKEEKPADTIRIALLGDSFVEAAQVSFEKTAGHLLEEKMNGRAKESLEKLPHFEVLNFGISCFGVGQYLLAWEKYASRFEPDYVFLFVSGRQMERTVLRYESGQFSETREEKLWIRPTFRMEKENLVREPARDFDRFVEVDRRLLETRFKDGTRIKRRNGFLIGDFLRDLRNIGKFYFEAPLRQLQRQFSNPPHSGILGMEAAVFRVNVKVMEVLGGQVSRRGGHLVIVDVFGYFDSHLSSPSRRLRKLCLEKGWGYVPLTNDLWKARREGIAVQWAHDGHFNEAGNRIFAEAMYRWLVNHVEI